jgi:hypothetical protein
MGHGVPTRCSVSHICHAPTGRLDWEDPGSPRMTVEKTDRCCETTRNCIVEYDRGAMVLGRLVVSEGNVARSA